jgi:hypothetical protein
VERVSVTEYLEQGLHASLNQAAAEFAFAQHMGWDDWTPEEEPEVGIVRGYRVQWHPDPNGGLVVRDEDDDEARYVLVTGEAPTYEVHDWISVGEARGDKPTGEG